MSITPKVAVNPRQGCRGTTGFPIAIVAPFSVTRLRTFLVSLSCVAIRVVMVRIPVVRPARKKDFPLASYVIGKPKFNKV